MKGYKSITQTNTFSLICIKALSCTKSDWISLLYGQYFIAFYGLYNALALLKYE